MSVSGRDSIVTFARIIGPVCCDSAKFLIRWDLIEQVRQHRRVADAATRDLDGTDLQRSFVYPDMYLAPQAALRASVLARVPLAFALRFDPGAVHQQVQWAFGASVSNGDRQRPLPPTQGAVIGNIPIEIDQFQQTFDKPCRLSQRQAEQYLDCQARLDRRIAIARLSTPLAGRLGLQVCLRVKPKGQ